MAKLRNFQTASSKRIMEYYSLDNNNHRYLLADEVGLGKTIVAGDVINRFVEKEREKGKESAVYYVCGNLALIAQNEKRLRNGFESFASFERRECRHDDMSRLVLSFIRDNYKKEFDDLIKILKGVSIWMLATKGTYTKNMFYRKNGVLREGLAKSLTQKDSDQNKLITKLFEQYSPRFDRYRYCVLEKSEDIYNLLLIIYEKLNGKSLDEKIITELNVILENYKLYDKENYIKLSDNEKKELIETENNIIEILRGFAVRYDELTETKTISFQSITPRTSIEKTSQGTWVERAAAGIIYYKGLNIQPDDADFQKKMDESIRGGKNDEEFKKVFSVIKNGEYESYHSRSKDAEQAMFLYENINKDDVNTIINAIENKEIKKADDLLKAIMEEMSKHSLNKAKKNKSVLVIVDEFQNYSKIFGTTISNECNEIKEKLLQDKEHYVLLLSATPFHFANANIGKESRYSSELQEIDSEVELIVNYVLGDKYDDWLNKENSEERYKILYENGVSRTERIDQAVNDGHMTLQYDVDRGLLLGDIKTLANMSDMRNIPKEIDEANHEDVVFLYKGYLYIYRNGKYFLANTEIGELFGETVDFEYIDYEEDEEVEIEENSTNKDANVKFYKVNKESEIEEIRLDEVIYDEKQKMKILGGVQKNTLPLSYIKDTPWVLSFVQGYNVPNHISENKYILSKKAIKKYKQIPVNHARFKKFQNIVLEPAYKFLFIPPSKPDYKLWGIYEQNSDYSKSLVFTKNYHTPRAFSAMLSYESERLNYKESNESGELYTDRRGYDLSGKRLVKYEVSVKRNKKLIECEIAWYKKLMNEKSSSPYKAAVEKMKKNKPLNKTDLFCLGSIAGYFLELFKDKKWEWISFETHLEKIVLALYSVFLTKEAYGILSKVDGNSYIKKIYNYNAQGNLRAVLDEYFHLILEDERFTLEDLNLSQFAELGKKYFFVIRDYMSSNQFKVKVNTKECESIDVYTNFAQGVTGDENKLDTQKALKNKMICFNSPFRPFVFTTTSVGAEGLDFHWYCTNVYHWALEMNPEKFQQKEGRINRFHCHGVRKNLGKDHPEASWEEIYNTEKKEENPFWPEWVYTGNGTNSQYTELKRHTLYYPGSYEDESYSEMTDNVKMYRDVIKGGHLCPMLKNKDNNNV